MEKQLKKVFKDCNPSVERRNTMPYPVRLKAKIISQYLKGEKSYRMLSVKYGIHPGVISRWVRLIKNGRPARAEPVRLNKFTAMKKQVDKVHQDLQAENKALKKQLADAELKTLLYQKIIEIAERDYNLDIVKKYGAGQPRKSDK